MASLSTPPTGRRSIPWRLALGALLVAGLSFLAGRVSVDEPRQREVVPVSGVPESDGEPANLRPQQVALAPPGTAAPVAPVPPPPPTPAPRFASPELIEQTRRETTVALQAQGEQISKRCWPEQPGQASARPRPRSVTFHVVFDGQGQEMSRSLADESGDLPPSIQACLVNSGDSVRISPPGLDLAVTATLELR